MRAAALGGLMLIGAAGYVAYARAGIASSIEAAPEPAPQPPAPTFVESAGDTWELLKQAIMPTAIDLTNQNLRAFLRAIRYAEGTAGPDGHRTLFGGALFASYADHPRQAITARLGGRRITSAAAGAYQFLPRTWDEAAAAMNLPDFSPPSQDIAAAFLVRRRRALADVYAGNFARAVAKCAREWASLPGSPYGQPTKSLAELAGVYLSHGGIANA